MSKYYDGALVMPKSCAVMNADEMTCVEGGGGIPVTTDMLNKDYCKAMAKDYTGTTGLDEDRIAQEIYAHAVLYLGGAGLHIMDAIKNIPFASSVSAYLMKCGKEVDLGNDTWYEVAIFKAIWHAGL